MVPFWGKSAAGENVLNERLSLPDKWIPLSEPVHTVT